MRKIFKVVSILVILIFTPGSVWALEECYTVSRNQYYQVITIYEIKNIGTTKAEKITMNILLGNPYLTKKIPYSTLKTALFIPQPATISADAKGNQRGTFFIESLQPGNKETIRLTYVYSIASVQYKIDPNLIEDYGPLLEVLSPYLNPSLKIESNHPLILTKAQEIIGDEKNPFLKAKKIFAYINGHMQYATDASQPAHMGALSALQTGMGVCEDYAQLMVALLRAAGVPSRTVSGWMGDVEDSLILASENEILLPGHMWVEYYLPPYGWITADPTYTYLYNGLKTVDYQRLTGINELRFAEESEAEGYAVSYSYYGSKLDLLYKKSVSKIESPPIFPTNNPVCIYLNDLPLFTDVEPQIINDRTLVPLRGIFNAFGAEVDWEPLTQGITVKSQDKVITLNIGEKEAQINGGEVSLDVAPMLVENRTMVPLRFISEALGVSVHWDGSQNTISLEI